MLIGVTGVNMVVTLNVTHSFIRETRVGLRDRSIYGSDSLWPAGGPKYYFRYRTSADSLATS